MNSMKIKFAFAFLSIGLACFAQGNQVSNADEKKTRRINTVLGEKTVESENNKALLKKYNKVAQIDSLNINDKDIFDRVVERHKNLINGF